MIVLDDIWKILWFDLCDFWIRRAKNWESEAQRQSIGLYDARLFCYVNLQYFWAIVLCNYETLHYILFTNQLWNGRVILWIVMRSRKICTQKVWHKSTHGKEYLRVEKEKYLETSSYDPFWTSDYFCRIALLFSTGCASTVEAFLA